jgi:hypothetical protein
MTISEFFDPSKQSHITAFECLMNSGTWPVNFLPNDICFSPTWPYDVTQKMVIFLIKENKTLKEKVRILKKYYY